MSDDLTRDFKYGFRALARDPGFAAVALMTLSLGIGANTLIFSVINSVLLKPLPYPEPDRLVVLDEYREYHGSRTVSWMDFQDWREQNRVFEDIAAYRLVDTSLTGHDEASLLRVAEVSTPFFKILGTQPQLGRLLTDHDDRPEAPPTIVISHSFWATRLAGRPDVVGQLLTLDNVSYSVIGVLPAAFDFVERRVDAYAPVGLHGADAEWLRRGNHPDLLGLARLRPGVPLTSARTAFDVIMRRLEHDYPESNTGLTAALTGLYEFRYGSTQRVLVMLLVAVGCVLLIACANVANLLLARASSRTMEIAIRAAVGASRWRLARQVMAESLILSFTGGALGIVLAILAERIATAAAPGILQVATVRVDGTVLALTVLVSTASAVLFGSAPAAQIQWKSLCAAISEPGRSGDASRRGTKMRSVLLVAEIAIPLVLLTTAGLVVRSLVNAMKADPGFEPDHLLSLELTIPLTRYTDPERKVGLLTQAVARLKDIPGIKAVGAAQCPPLSGVCVDTGFMLEDHPVASVVDIPTAASNIVAPGYLEAMRVPLLSGRLFSETDDRRGRMVAIVNHTFAQATGRMKAHLASGSEKGDRKGISRIEKSSAWWPMSNRPAWTLRLAPKCFCP
jgi:putative ABC transport system permease protein